MKKFKLIPAITFVILVISYVSIYSTYSNTSVYNALEQKDLIAFTQLEENDQIKIIGLPQDSVTAKPDFSEEGKVILSQLPNEKYKAFQGISTQMTTVSEKIYFIKRLILLGFLMASILVAFKNKFKYDVTFQKALYENVKMSMLFVLFSIVALLLTQTILGTVRSGSQMAQILFTEGITTLKYAVLYAVFIAAFIYFHPQNIHWYNKRVARKQKQAEKAAK